VTSYFGDLSPEDRFISVGRTITQADIQTFAGLSGDYNPLHTDEEWVRANTAFEGRIAHGLLTLAIGSGIRTPGIDELQVLGYLEVQRQMKRPVYPGDTIRVTQTVEQLTPSRSRPGAGIVRLRVDTHNQHGELVQTGLDTLLVGGKGDS